MQLVFSKMHYFGLVITVFSLLDSVCAQELNIPVAAQLTGRGAIELRVCTQNLHNLGITNSNVSASTKKKKSKTKQLSVTAHAALLAKRMHEAHCDVIAVQELGGETKDKAKKVLGILADELKSLSGCNYDTYVAETNDQRIRNGFLVNDKIGKPQRTFSFNRAYVPSLDSMSPQRRFSRGPFGVWLSVPSMDASRMGDTEAQNQPTNTRTIAILTFHLKSQWGHWKDPSKTAYENMRMEMAEGLRRIARDIAADIGEGGVVLLLGDRNASYDAPSSLILSGENILADFIKDGKKLCGVTQQLESTCVGDKRYPAYFLDLFAYKMQLLHSRPTDIGSDLWSFEFKGRRQLYDEIYIEAEDSWIAKDNNGVPSIGALGDKNSGSDHRLMWVDLNW